MTLARTAIIAAPLLGALLFAGLPAQAQPASGQKIGVAGAVNPQAKTTPPGEQTRVVMVGGNVVSRERIVTGPEGAVQLLFTDKSTLTIGRNSDVTLDQYVFDPTSGKGAMAVSMTRGVMRFVGGQLSHDGNAKVTTPQATIGIRGGIALFEIGAQERIVNVFGNTKVTAKNCQAKNDDDCSVTIIRAGYATTLSGPGTPPGAPSRLSGDAMVGLTDQLQSSPTQDGGAPVKPSDSTAQQSGSGQSQSGLIAQNVQPQPPQGGAVQPISATDPALAVGPGPGVTEPAPKLGDIGGQTQIALQGVEPTNFPDGVTSIGDLRTVTAPRTFNYSQLGVVIFDNTATPVGSYDFNMTIKLGSNTATRGFIATASNVNAPLFGVSGFSISFNAQGNDFTGLPNGAFGFGVSTSCAAGVDCQLGFAMNNVGGRVAKTVDHSFTIWNTGSPSPPPLGPGVAIGSGTVARP